MSTSARDDAVAAGPPDRSDPGREPSRAHHLGLHGELDLSPEEEHRREIKHRIADEVRRLTERVVLLDAASSGEADLRPVLDAAHALSERLAALPAHPDGLNRAAGWEAALTERSPVSGRSNPLAVPLTVRFEGQRTVGEAWYGRSHEGPLDHVHGGVVMGAFDELLGVAQGVSEKTGYTGTLKVVMRAPTPLFTRIDYEAGVDRVEGRKVLVWGRSSAGGRLLCEAEGIFISPRDSDHVHEHDAHKGG